MSLEFVGCHALPGRERHDEVQRAPDGDGVPQPRIRASDGASFPDGGGILQPTVVKPLPLGAVVEDAARAVGAVPLRVSAGVGEQMVSACALLEELYNPADPQNGDCAIGDDRIELGCGFNLNAAARKWELRVTPESLDTELQTQTATFDPRTYTNGGTCGWIDVDLAHRAVMQGVVRYGARAGGTDGEVVMRFVDGALVDVDLNRVIEGKSRRVANVMQREVDDVVDRLRTHPTLDDYRWLRRRDQQQEHLKLLDTVAGELEADLAEVAAPIAVSTVTLEPVAEGTWQASVAVSNVSSRAISLVELGLLATKADGSIVPGQMCDPANLTETLTFSGGTIGPGETMKVFQRQPERWSTLGLDPREASLSVVPLRVAFADGGDWLSWVTVRHAASPCDDR